MVLSCSRYGSTPFFDFALLTNSQESGLHGFQNLEATPAADLCQELDIREFVASQQPDLCGEMRGL